MKAAIYVRVSTFDQEPDNQLAALRRSADVRGWTATAYVDNGVSGAKTSGPHLTNWSRMRAADDLTSWWCGGWIASGATCGI